MPDDHAVSEHYSHGDLLGAIEGALAKLGKSTDDVTIEDLAPVDEFHIGGRIASDHFLSQLNFSNKCHVLDVGCGLGGASRFVADRYRSRVTGVDLTQEYIDTGNVLCEWVALHDQIDLQQGSALAMSFEEYTFDGAFMMHVGMNIEDKDSLFTEIHRVLRPGSVFGVYDVMRRAEGELIYPVPWATEDTTSRLASPDEYRNALQDAGFEVLTENSRLNFALNFFKELRAKTEANGGPPPLGLHTLMQETTGQKIGNMIDNITEGLVAPVEMIARKR